MGYHGNSKLVKRIRGRNEADGDGVMLEEISRGCEACFLPEMVKWEFLSHG